MAYCLVVERSRPEMGRNQDKTYVNVVLRRQLVGGQTQTLAQWVAANPGHPWNDSQFGEFVIEITETEFNNFGNQEFPFFHDGQGNNPKWQQRNSGTGATAELGSWTDPVDDTSVWQADTEIPDDRWIVRIYNLDPVAQPSATHLASEEFDEGAAGATVTRFIRLFRFDDTPSNTNAANQRTEIGGKLIDFDFGSSDALSAGVARIQFGIDVPGRGEWFSNHRYRIVGPGGEKSYVWQVFGKALRIVAE